MKNPTVMITLVLAVVVMLLPISLLAKYVLAGLIIVLFLYIRRGYVYVALASKSLHGKNPNPQKAWVLYEKGWRAGLSQHYATMLGNLFTQQGDIQVALQIFDSVVEKETRKRKASKEIIAGAKISKSMALWVLKRQDEAISLLQNLWKEGYMDKNLAINLGSYLLETGRLQEAQELIEESSEKLPESPGMIDNRGLYLYLIGSFFEAQSLYDTFITDSKPKFPEAYVHAAQVKISLGKNQQARQLLKTALEKPFYQTSTIRQEEVTFLLESLPDTSSDEIDEEVELLEEELYEGDLFEDEGPNTEVDDDDDIEPNIELDDEDYDDEEDPIVIVDHEDISEIESQVFDDDFEEEEIKPRD